MYSLLQVTQIHANIGFWLVSFQKPKKEKKEKKKNLILDIYDIKLDQSRKQFII